MIFTVISKNNNCKFNWKWLTWSPLITFAVVFLIYLTVSLLRLDPDFGWHLKSGEYFLSNGIPTHDVFTYTASSFLWINHEWLSDILLFVTYSIGGYLGVSVVYSGLWTLAIWLVGCKAHNLVVLLAVLATVPFAGVRAITWSVLGLALLITLVNTKNKKLRWLIPLLFLVWANIHGSFIIGFAYLMYEAVRQRSKRLTVLLIIGALITFINPYGASIYIEVWRTVIDSSLKWRITEWMPLVIPWMSMPFVLMWSSGFALSGWKDWRKYFGLDVLSFIAGLAGTRNLVLFVILAVGITGERLRSTAATIPKDLDKPRRRLIVTTGSIIATAVLMTIVMDYWGVSLDREAASPKKVVAYLHQNPCDGRLFNHYNYGGYLIWKLPSHKVYIDGRMPSWELGGRKYMDDYLDVLKNVDTRRREFQRYNIRCVIIPKDYSKKDFTNPLLNEGWKVSVEDPSVALLLHP